jgi:hypothetical protein
MSRPEEPMRTTLTILTIAALAGGCDTANAPADLGGDGEAPTTDPAAFDIQPVFVANDSTSAVPVSATQSGDWNVAVTGPVEVTGTVAIANTDVEAIPVRNVTAEGVQTPWIREGQVIVPIGRTWASNQLYAPPFGKRLVIEYITIDVNVPSGQIAHSATILGSADGEGAIFRFPLQATSSNSSTRALFTTAQQVKLNVSGGVVVTAQRSGTAGAAIADVSLSGYLVDD